MLSLFPSLLDFSFFAPTILRLVVGIIFILEGYWHVRSMEKTRLSLVRFGSLAGPATYATVGFSFLIGASLALGIYMQLGALLGLVYALKVLALRSYFPEFSNAPRGYWALMAATCAALMLTGAGAFAFDLPL